jgi:hypothetical protein
MKWKLIGAATIVAACMTTACSDSGNLAQPSSLPSAQPSSVPSSSPLSAAQQTADGPVLCTNLAPCPGGVDAGPPPEASCSMITNGIEVVVNGSRQSNGVVLADFIGQVPPGTQPAPPGDEVFGLAPGPGDGIFVSGDGVFTVAKGDALGRVAGIQGRCPDLTFTVGGTPVATNGSTKYFGLPSPPPPRS